MAAEQAQFEAQAAGDGGGEAGRFTFRQRILLCAVAALGLAVSVMPYRILSLHESRVAEAEFQLHAEKEVETISQTIANRLSVLELLKSFYAGSLDVQQDEFKTFSVSILKNNPDIELLAWIPRVPAAQRRAHEEDGMETGMPQYKIVERGDKGFLPAAQREVYYPIEYVEPREDHAAIIGLDLGSQPECLAAIDRAQAIDGPVISYAGISGLNAQAENLLYVFEVAHTEMPAPPAASDTAHNTTGLILGAFDLKKLVSEALEVLRPTGVDIYFFDVTDPDKPIHILSKPSRIRATAMPILSAPPAESSPTIDYTANFHVADQKWQAYCVPTDVYFSGRSRWGPLATMCVGLVITGLVVGQIYLLLGRTAGVESLVAQRTRELQASEVRFRLLVENAADAFFLIDENGRVLDINQRACKFLGYSREELLKLNVLDFEVGFKPEEHHELTWKRPAADFPINVNGVHRRKNGSTYPVEVRLSCMETTGERLLIAIVRDVSERRQAEEALRKEQRFLRHLIDLQERERKLMAYEIHDGLAQHLTAAVYKLQVLEMAVQQQDAEKTREILAATLRLMRESVEEARRLIGGLRPPILDEMGIIAAIEYLIGEWQQSSGVQIEFAHQVRFHRLAPPLEVALFRIAQECLTNACRYSQSPKIRVELGQGEARVRLAVQDWGVGFDPQTVKGESFGLRGIRERVRLLGGVVEMNSAAGKGTTITVELPFSEVDISDYNDT